MEYFDVVGGGSASLSWYSASQPKQVVPIGRLHPGLQVAPSSITSPLFAYAFLGQPFSYTVTGANTPTRFSATPLPAGLLFNTTNGILSGTPTVAGDYQISISASNAV